MYNKGLVSIVMPAYNCAGFISESIDSVLAQTYKNWELIVVNDCSTDNTRSIVESFVENDKRIRLINNITNSGVAATRNNAIKAAKGQYVAFLDSDDIWFENKLEMQVSKLSNSPMNAVACHTSYLRIDEKGKILSKSSVRKDVNFRQLLKSNSIGNLTGVVDRLKADLPLQKEIKHEDYVMWLSILSKESSYYSIGLNEVLAKYRVHNSSVSANKLKSITWHWNILRNEMRLNLLKSCMYLVSYVYFATKKRA